MSEITTRTRIEIQRRATGWYARAGGMDEWIGPWETANDARRFYRAIFEVAAD